MKNVIAGVLSAVVFFMTSCSPSKEEKAERLIGETLKGYLYHPDSYEPISTRVDSMFIDVTAIEPIMENSDEIRELISKIKRCEGRVKSAESDLDTWGDAYSTRLYAQAKKEKEEAESDLDKYNRKLSEQLASLKENVAGYYKGEFTGWAIIHRYRSLNGGGSMSIPGEAIFFCDPEFTACIGYEVDKFDRFTEILKVVEESASDEDIMDFFKGK